MAGARVGSRGGHNGVPLREGNWCEKFVLRSQAEISAALTTCLGSNLPVSISYGPASTGNSGGAALAVSMQFPPNNQLSATVPSLSSCAVIHRAYILHVQLGGGQCA